MARAERIQQHLLPHDLNSPGLRVTHLFQPADTIAGDFFDRIELPNGDVVFCVADVTGHGVAAALTASMLKSLLSNAAEDFSDPAEILASVNNRLVTASK